MSTIRLEGCHFEDNGVGISLVGQGHDIVGSGNTFVRNGKAIEARDSNLRDVLGLPQEAPIGDLIELLNSLNQIPPVDKSALQACVNESKFGTWLANAANGVSISSAILDWATKGYLAGAIVAAKALVNLP